MILEFIVACVILGVEYIHKNGLIHRDIKPENVLLDRNGYAKITDFGISKYKNDINKHRELNGTLGYIAPETILKRYQSYSVDYFSIGILVYELIRGTIPFQGNNIKEIKEFFISQEIKLNFDIESSSSCSCDLLSDEVKDFISCLIKRKPKERLGYWEGISELKRHNWFKGFNWNALEQFELRAEFIPRLPENYDEKYFNRSSNNNVITNSEKQYNMKELNELKQMKFANFTFIKPECNYEEEKNKDDDNDKESNYYNYNNMISYRNFNNPKFESGVRYNKLKRIKVLNKHNYRTPNHDLSYSPSKVDNVNKMDESIFGFPKINLNKMNGDNKECSCLFVKKINTRNINYKKQKDDFKKCCNCNGRSASCFLGIKERYKNDIPSFLKSKFFHSDMLINKSIFHPECNGSEEKKDNSFFSYIDDQHSYYNLYKRKNMKNKHYSHLLKGQKMLINGKEIYVRIGDKNYNLLNNSCS